jgi:glutaredoxin
MTFKEKFITFKKIEKLCKKVNKIRFINSGGCCVYAYHLSTVLKSLNIKYKIVVIDSSKSTAKYLKSCEEYNDMPYLGANHVMIYTNGFYIDSRGIGFNPRSIINNKLESINRYVGGFNPTITKIDLNQETFYNWAYNTNNIWNNMFDIKHRKKIENACAKLKLD